MQLMTAVVATGKKTGETVHIIAIVVKSMHVPHLEMTLVSHCAPFQPHLQSGCFKQVSTVCVQIS